MNMIITKANVSEYNITGEFDIAASFKADKDSDESKTVTLRFVMENEPLVNIIGSSLKDKRINWQVTARNNFNSITDKSVVKVKYVGGRGPQESAEEKLAREIADMTPEQAAAYIMAKVKALQAK